MHLIKSSSRRTVLGMLATLTLAAVVATGADKPKKLLVVTITTGFRHSSIETAETILEKIGKESGVFTVDFARVTPPKVMNKPNPPKPSGNEKRDAEAKKRYESDLAKYTADEANIKEALAKYDAERKAVLADKMSLASLKKYDGVIFANTTGDLPLPDPQGFIDWVKAGHGFAAMHSGSDTFHGFKPYVEMLGAEFKTHGPQVQVDCLNDDSQHAACKHLPASWSVFDEIYQMNSYNRGTVHNLLSLDKHPDPKMNGEAGHFPVAWCKEFGKGRIFYTSLGHREDMWDDNAAMSNRKNSPEVSKAYQKHVLEGIKWSLGLAKGDAKPQHR